MGWKRMEVMMTMALTTSASGGRGPGGGGYINLLRSRSDTHID